VLRSLATLVTARLVAVSEVLSEAESGERSQRFI